MDTTRRIARNLTTTEQATINDAALAAVRDCGVDAKLEAFRARLSPDLRAAFREVEDALCAEAAAIQLRTWAAARCAAST